MSTDLIRVVAQPTELTVDAAGGQRTITVQVFNLSTIIDGYRIDIPQAPPWLRVQPADLRLLPGTEESVEVLVSVPRAEQVPAGQTTLYLRVQSLASAQVTESVRIDVSVAATESDVDVRLEPSQLNGDHVTTRLTLHKRAGNTPVSVHMSGTDPEGSLHFQFNPVTVTLAPQQTVAVDVTVQGRPLPRGGEDKRSPFTILANDGRETAQAQGQLLQTAPPPPPPRPEIPIRPIVRFAGTLGGALFILLGSFRAWNAGVSGANLNVQRLCPIAEDPLNLNCALADGVPGINTPVMSLAAVTVVLGVLAALGVFGRGGLTSFAGISTIAYVLAVFVALSIFGVGIEVGQGAIAVGLGGVMAAVGGLAARGG